MATNMENPLNYTLDKNATSRSKFNIIKILIENVLQDVGL